MHLSIAASLLAISSAQAFSDSSPFVLFSTAKFPSKLNDDQLQTSSQLLASVKELLSSCPTNRYLLVSQPNIHATDLRGPSGCQAPNLCRALEDGKTRGRFSVAEMIGSLSFEDFSDYIKAACLEKGRQATVEQQQLQSLPIGKGRTERAEMLADNDRELGRMLEKYGEDGDFTTIYFSNPHEFKQYEAEFVDPVHEELKRQTSSTVNMGTRQKNDTRRAPLFEKYQFFTPGIFMGFMALFVMLSILYVGLSALSSLQVSYGAFDKEMGPSAQKKQQ